MIHGVFQSLPDSYRRLFSSWPPYVPEQRSSFGPLRLYFVMLLPESSQPGVILQCIQNIILRILMVKQKGKVTWAYADTDENFLVDLKEERHELRNLLSGKIQTINVTGLSFLSRLAQP
jgi:hypothetical protein